MEEVIAARGLTRRFGSIIALDGLSLSVQRGEVFGLLGHNGAGKTTTIRLLNGVLLPSGGGATVLGMDPSSDGPRIRRNIGVLTESPGLDPRMAGREVLRFFAELYEVPADGIDCRIDDLLSQFGLGERAEDRVQGYSSGMRQRLALARALLHHPNLLFLDEPTSGLDPIAAHELRMLILRLAKEESVTVVLCTHNLDEAQMLCNRVAILQSGRLLRIGTVDELRESVTGARKVQVKVRADDVAEAQNVAASLGFAPQRDREATVVVEVGDREDVPKIVAALADAGIGIYEVATPEVSLEDVYFRLHGLGDAA